MTQRTSTADRLRAVPSRLFARLKWLYPGLGVKRWLSVAFVGAILFANGWSRWLTAEGSDFHINETVDTLVADFVPLGAISWAFMVAGLGLLFWSIASWQRSIVVAVRPEEKDRIVEALLERRLGSGYKIVAIGGGTGLSTLLRGLKRYTRNITAIVTVTDDGGSSGRLQKELGILPPGDIRNCLVALADDEALVTDLFQYRFAEGEGLTGHSFGNLFLAAMTGITGNFDVAIKESSRVLNIKGRVLPATLEPVRLCATLADGTYLEGETTISKAHSPIAKLSIEPPNAAPLPAALEAIREADVIVLGPGSLYTSVLPNFLIAGIADAVAAARCPRVYVCNVMTQPGETDDFTAAQHVRALLELAGRRVVDTAIVNEQRPERLLGRYATEGQVPVIPDVERIETLGVRVVGARVISEEETVRHDPQKVAEAVIKLIDDVVIARSSFTRLATAPVPANGARAASASAPAETQARTAVK